MSDFADMMLTFVSAPLFCLLVLVLIALGELFEMAVSMRTYRNGGVMTKEDWKIYT